MLGCLQSVPVSAASSKTQARTYYDAHTKENMNRLSCKNFVKNSEKNEMGDRIICTMERTKITSHPCEEAIFRSDLHYHSKLNKGNLAVSLSRFITEVHKLDRTEYPPQTLHQMIICMQMFLETEKLYWKLFDNSDQNFADLYYILDNVMKE